MTVSGCCALPVIEMMLYVCLLSAMPGMTRVTIVEIMGNHLSLNQLLLRLKKKHNTAVY